MEAIDLPYLRDLLSLLSEYKVAAFSNNGLSLAFHEPEPGYVPRDLKPRATDGAVEVTGFKDRELEGFRHPTLWPGQNGKLLTFDGSYD